MIKNTVIDKDMGHKEIVREILTVLGSIDLFLSF